LLVEIEYHVLKAVRCGNFELLSIQDAFAIEVQV